MFALFPILFLYAQNALEMRAESILPPLLLAVIFATAVTLLLGLLLKNFKKSGLIASLAVLLFFSYGHVLNVLPKFSIPAGPLVIDTGLVLLIVSGIVMLAGLFLVLKTGRNLWPFTKILNAASVGLVVIQIVTAGFILLSRPTNSEIVQTPLEMEAAAEGMPGSGAQYPDIYYIIMDGYGGQDILKRVYGIDNSPFLNFLSQKGFSVHERAWSNYGQTLLSMASTLNMDYIPNLLKTDPQSNDRMPLSAVLHDNQVFRILRQKGYSIAAFSSGYDFTEFPEADYYIKPEGALGEFENILFTSTMLSQARSPEDSLFHRHRERVLFILDGLARIKRTEKPLLVIAHVISPHPPFIFKKDGGHRERNWEFNFNDGSHYTLIAGKADYIEGYSAQVFYITEMLQKTISGILDRYADDPPIIVLQADHGPGSGLDWSGLKNTDVGERFSTLSAVLLPKKNARELKKNFSPVNIFRFILNEYFNTAYQLLPPKSYYSTWEKPFNFQDITDALKAIAETWDGQRAPSSR